MDRLSSHQATKEVVQKHNFKFSKSLGQNFLIDTNVIDKIIAGARIKEGDYVIEVGPGIGTLTKEMGKNCMVVPDGVEHVEEPGVVGNHLYCGSSRNKPGTVRRGQSGRCGPAGWNKTYYITWTAAYIFRIAAAEYQ